MVGLDHRRVQLEPVAFDGDGERVQQRRVDLRVRPEEEAPAGRAPGEGVGAAGDEATRKGHEDLRAAHGKRRAVAARSQVLWAGLAPRPGRARPARRVGKKRSSVSCDFVGETNPRSS
jgi:hypothetical protein